MSSIVDEIYAFNKQAGLLGKGMDSFMETSHILEATITGYEDVFNQPDDPKAPTITANDWAISFLNQVKEAKELRSLPMPSADVELAKYVKLAIASISNLTKLGKTAEEIEQIINTELQNELITKETNKEKEF